MQTKILFTVLFLFPYLLCGQSDTILYRIVLNDKGNSQYSLDNPNQFLSQKSIDRRLKQGFALDETDLPIDTNYFSILKSMGAEIYAHSKWVATIVVSVPNENVLNTVQELPWVKEIYPVYDSKGIDHSIKLCPDTIPEQNFLVAPYSFSSSQWQVDFTNGLFLHSLGYKGEGISIAVMDTDFIYIDLMDNVFNPDRIKEVKNFTHTDHDPLRCGIGHGTVVTSVMLAHKDGVFIGTSPEADYYLFQTEINYNYFNPISEDYWVAALEYADSIGIDIASTSLGFSRLDDTTDRYTADQLDGWYVLASRAASMAARKGMVLCIAAGNKGKYGTSAPADAFDILAVGGTNVDSTHNGASSYQTLVDGRIKPDVATSFSAVVCGYAQGMGQFVIGGFNIGTSFSCPIIAGLTACLWGAFPELTSLEIMDLIKSTAHLANSPDTLLGYGIPNFMLAYNTVSSIKDNFSDEFNPIIIDYVHHLISILGDDIFDDSRLVIYDILGQEILATQYQYAIDISNLQRGVYIAIYTNNSKNYHKLFIRK